jgi:hypothetical protein
MLYLKACTDEHVRRDIATKVGGRGVGGGGWGFRRGPAEGREAQRAAPPSAPRLPLPPHPSPHATPPRPTPPAAPRQVSTLAERYAPDTTWFIATMAEVFELAGDTLPPSVAHNLMRLIAEQVGAGVEARAARWAVPGARLRCAPAGAAHPRFKHPGVATPFRPVATPQTPPHPRPPQEEEVQSTAVSIFLRLLDRPSGRPPPDVLLHTICWVLGEYGRLAAALPPGEAASVVQVGPRGRGAWFGRGREPCGREGGAGRVRPPGGGAAARRGRERRTGGWGTNLGPRGGRAMAQPAHPPGRHAGINSTPGPAPSTPETPARSSTGCPPPSPTRGRRRRRAPTS